MSERGPSPGTAADLESRGLFAQLLDPNLRLPERPVFLPDLDVFEMPDGLGFQFRGGEAPVLLRGRRVASIVQYLRISLDGVCTIERLLSGAPSDVPSAALARTLLLLHSKGVLVSAEAPVATATPSPADASSIDSETLNRQQLYWGRHLGLTRSASSSKEVERRLASARIVLVGTGIFGSVTSDLLIRSGFQHIKVLAWNDDGVLERSADKTPVPLLGFHRLPSTSFDPALLLLSDWCDGADLLITATCDAPSALFQSINDLLVHSRTPALYGNTDGSAIDIGPLVQPYETACYACLALRRQSAQDFPIESELYEEHRATERDSSERVLVGEAVWPATLAASLLVGEACRFISGLAPATLIDNVIRVLPVSGTMEQNHIVRVPRCPTCFRGEIPSAKIET